MTRSKSQLNARHVTRATPALILALAMGGNAVPMAFATGTETTNETITYTEVAPQKLSIAYEGEKTTYVANLFTISKDCDLVSMQVKTSAEGAKVTKYLVRIDGAQMPAMTDPSTLKNLLKENSDTSTEPTHLKKGDRLLAIAEVTRKQGTDPEKNDYLVEMPMREQKPTDSTDKKLISKNESLVWQDGKWADVVDWLATEDVKTSLTQHGITDALELDNPAIDLIVTAPKPEQQTPTVTFDKNAEDATGTMEPQEIPADATTKLTACTFKRDGYKFTAWNTKTDGSGQGYTDQEAITIEADTTLYAQWEAEPTKPEETNDDNNTDNNNNNNNNTSNNNTNQNNNGNTSNNASNTNTNNNSTNDTSKTTGSTAVQESSNTSSNTNRTTSNTTSNNSSGSTSSNGNRTTTSTSSVTTPNPTMSNDKSGQYASRSQTITYTIRQNIPSDATSITITHNLDDAMEYVDAEGDIKATCTGQWKVTETRIDGQKLTVSCERDGSTSSSQTATVAFKAKVKTSADLTNYLESSNSKIAKIPYQCSTQFIGNSTRTAQSTKEYVKFSLGTNEVKGSTTSSNKSNSSSSSNTKSDGQSLATTSDPTSVTGVIALLAAGLAGLAFGLRKKFMAK